MVIVNLIATMIGNSKSSVLKQSSDTSSQSSVCGGVGGGGGGAAVAPIPSAAAAAAAATAKQIKCIFIHGYGSSGKKMESSSKGLVGALKECNAECIFLNSPYEVKKSEAAAAETGSETTEDKSLQWWRVDTVTDCTPAFCDKEKCSGKTIHHSKQSYDTLEGSLEYLQRAYNATISREENDEVCVLIAFSQGTSLALHFLDRVEKGALKVHKKPALAVLVCPFKCERNPDWSRLNSSTIVLVHGKDDPLIPEKDRLVSPPVGSLVKTFEY